MFGIGGTELAIIAVFAFLIFGPDKVPELARTLGKAMRMFKSAQEDMERVIKAEIDGVSPTKPSDPSSPADSSAPSAASSIWAATADDDEEEDEE